MATSAFCVAAAGTTQLATCVQQNATATRRTTATTILASALPELDRDWMILADQPIFQFAKVYGDKKQRLPGTLVSRLMREQVSGSCPSIKLSKPILAKSL